jgi:1,4-alpha-glucan branching enzyme
VQVTEDPYSFGLLLGELDVYLLAEGNHLELGRCLGAQVMTIDDIVGVRFAVWAPNARRVSVVGDFNGWDGRRHPMRKRVEAGVWELFIPRLPIGTVYKYEILGPHGLLPLKADPVALQVEVTPRTASVVSDPAPFEWIDARWLQARGASGNHLHAPLSIYEVHAASWRRHAWDWRPLNWDELGEQLIPYVKDLKFTHIELLPIMGHPFGGSWGYQVLSQYAPQAEFGEPAAFARFVDRCHNAGIGVILDWVPGHFPTDAHGLAWFDGTALYEHADAREGFHQEWNTAVYNLGRREVHSFLISSALHWLERYHIDGLRVDAVASLLYRDYARREGQWIPNRYGGRENLEAIDFLRHLNDAVAQRFPGALVIAEESTAWPGVTQPTQAMGTGLQLQMEYGLDARHVALHVSRPDPSLLRPPRHDLWLAVRVLRALRAAALARRGRPRQGLADRAHARGIPGSGSRTCGPILPSCGRNRARSCCSWAANSVRTGNGITMPARLGGAPASAASGRPSAHHRSEPGVSDRAALHALDCDSAGFRWIVGDDRDNSVFAWYRSGYDDTPPIVAVCNFTPVPRHHYRIGVPRAGGWHEILNTDAQIYGGSNLGNGGWVQSSSATSHGQPFSLELTLPPWLRYCCGTGGENTRYTRHELRSPQARTRWHARSRSAPIVTRAALNFAVYAGTPSRCICVCSTRAAAGTATAAIAGMHRRSLAWLRARRGCGRALWLSRARPVCAGTGASLQRQ